MSVEAQENSTHQGMWLDKGEIDSSLNSWTFKLQIFFFKKWGFVSFQHLEDSQELSQQSCFLDKNDQF